MSLSNANDITDQIAGENIYVNLCDLLTKVLHLDRVVAAVFAERPVMPRCSNQS
jgi:hypothetical protein